MTDEKRPTEADPQQPDQDETQDALRSIEGVIGEQLTDRQNPPDKTDGSSSNPQKKCRIEAFCYSFTTSLWVSYTV